MAIKIQLRRGTAAEWTSANPVLMQGEMGVETDTLKVKIGNGTSAWTTLPYFTQGAKGDKGDQGIQGIQGVQGNTGPVGPVGPANSLSVGSVTTGIEGSDAEVTITGTAPNQTMSLVIPRGDKGDAATITVGTVTQVAAGQPATVTNSGTSAAAVLNFEIPNAVGVPTGGTAGQIVRKTASGTEWADMPPSQLSGQTDVSISSPQNKQVLKYDGSKWVNATASGGVTVSESSPADPSNGDGWFFAADGTQFVRYDDGTSVQWVQPNAVLSSQIEQRYYSPNYLINGALEINQRNFTSTSSSLAFTFDRWMTEGASAGGTITWSAANLNPGEIKSDLPTMGKALQITTSSLGASNYALISQKIEDVRTIAGKRVTVSWWAKAASGAPNMQVVLQNNYGTGGSPNTRQNSGHIQLSTSWARYSFTFDVPSAEGKTVGANSWSMPYFLVSDGVIFNTLGAQNNTFSFWGFQLEEGSTASPFRRNANSLQGELAACQRYYYRATGQWAHTLGSIVTAGVASTSADIFVPFPVTMRVAPTSVEANGVEFSRPGVGEYSATSYAFPTYILGKDVGVLRCNFASSLAATTMYQYRFNVSNGYMGWSAEL